MRREILFDVLNAVRASKSPEVAREALEQARVWLAAVPPAFRAVAEEEVRKLERAYNLQADATVGLTEALENPRDVSGMRRPVQPFVAAMVRMGIHPFDDAG